MQTNKTKPITRLMAFTGVICLLSAILASPALGAAYLKVGDIKGESIDRDHKDWINILSFHKSVDVPESSGLSARPDIAQPSPFVASKYIDKASPQLALHCCNGQHIPEATLEVTSDTQQRLTYYRVKMTNVFVSSYSVSGDGDTVPVDQISLNYEEVEWTFFEYDEAGRLVAQHTTSWNFEDGGSTFIGIATE